MKLLLIYLVFMYIVFCADDVADTVDTHSWEHKAVRALLWPITITNWFRTQSIRLHRMLNILWCVLIGGWFVTLILDRI